MDLLKEHQSEIDAICVENNISYLGVFGSYARGDNTENSDIDLLVRFSKPVSFFTMMDVEDKFSTTLHKKIDLLTEEDISPLIKPYVDKDVTALYDRA